MVAAAHNRARREDIISAESEGTFEAMASADFFYNPNGSDKPLGPVSLDDLRVMAAQGTITGNTPVIREGAAEWGRYRDFQAGERTREVAEAVVDRAARMATALQTEESKSFGLGLLIGIVRLATLPWELVRAAVERVSEWGSNRFVSLPPESLVSSTYGRIGMPIWVLLWTVWWGGDCVAMIVVGRPSFTLSIVSIWSGILTMGFSLPQVSDLSSRMMYASAKASFTEALTVQDFGNRIAWAIKLGLLGYFITPAWALLGELFSGLAAIIARNRAGERKPNLP